MLAKLAIGPSDRAVELFQKTRSAVEFSNFTLEAQGDEAMAGLELGLAFEPQHRPLLIQPTGFRIGSILKRAVLVFAENFFPLWGIAGIAVMPGLIVPATKDGYAPINLGLPTWAPISLYAASILLGQSIICFLAFERMRGRSIGLRDGLNVGLHSSLPLVGMALLIFVILGILQSLSGSYPAAVVAGVMLLPVWWTALPVCVIEGLGPLRGIKRGWALTKGHRGKMLVLVLLANAAGLGLLVTMGFLVRAILSIGPPGIFGPAARIDGLTWTALWSAFFAVLLAVSYHELRAAKGGDDPDRIVDVFE